MKKQTEEKKEKTPQKYNGDGRCNKCGNLKNHGGGGSWSTCDCWKNEKPKSSL